jgi:hypothetical protein
MSARSVYFDTNGQPRFYDPAQCEIHTFDPLPMFKPGGRTFRPVVFRRLPGGVWLGEDGSAWWQLGLGFVTDYFLGRGVDLPPSLCADIEASATAPPREDEQVGIVPGQKATTPARPEAPVVLGGPDDKVIVWGEVKDRLPRAQYRVLKALVEAHAKGERLSTDSLRNATKDGKGNVVEDPMGALKRLRKRDADFGNLIDMAKDSGRGYGLNDRPPTPTQKNPVSHPRRPRGG